MEWRHEQLLRRLAVLKAEIKALETEAKAITDGLVSTYGIDLPPKYLTTDGTLTLTVRANYGKLDNYKVIEVMGQEAFIKKASITVSKIKEFGGDQMIDRLLDLGVITVEPPTIYYTLKA